MPNLAEYSRWQRRPLELARELVRDAERIDYYRKVLALEAAHRGAPISDVAEALDVSRQTIYTWQQSMTEETRARWVEIAETRTKHPRAFNADQWLVDVFNDEEPEDEPFDPLLDADAEKATGGLVDAETLDAKRRAAWARDERS